MKPRKTSYLLLTIAMMMLSGCSKAQQWPSAQENVAKSSKILIVYLSRTNNTKAVAEMIKEYTGGELVALELEKPYPEDYKAIVEHVAKENETGYLPALKTLIENIEEYDTIFVGFPTWGMELPPPMKSFLHQYDLSGKTVIPFNTNAGYGTGSSFETVKKLCPNSTMLKGLSLEGGVERDGILFVMKGENEKEARKEVLNWLKELKIVQ